MPYCIYLRKSRKDDEAEARGEGETLARHERLLTELAEKLSLSIMQIYREIVSGETIASRPVMQRLLSEVEQGIWDGVLVAEVERLARGDSIDQGIVAQAFKISNTKIITPIKTYDPNNEFDEEYFEFGLFMSRREYKTINRRLQRGRIAAAKEGKYVASTAPFGYKRVKLKNDKGYTLEIIPEEAEVVRLIFDMYTNTGGGIQAVAKELNKMGVPPVRHNYWQKETIRDILTNPVYIGKIRWGWRKSVKRQSGGQISVSRPLNFNEDCVIADGLHKPIISEEIFNKAQNNMSPALPINHKSTLKNPLAGLIKCGKCGKSMVFRRRSSPQKKDYLVCHSRDCSNVSSPFEMVEQKLLDALKIWYKEYEIKLERTDSNTNHQELRFQILKKLKREKSVLEKQKNNLHDLLEQGVYTKEMFSERTEILSKKISETNSRISALENEITAHTDNVSFRGQIPETMAFFEAYEHLTNIETKNLMLKEILEKAVYTKTAHGGYKGQSADDFELIIYPKACMLS